MLVSIGTMMGQPILELEASSIDAILFGTGLGWAFVVRLIALTATVAALLLPAIQASRLHVAALFAIVALGSLAGSGHAAVTEGSLGAFHRLNDALHLLIAAIWIGAIVGFMLSAWKQGRSGRPDQLSELADALRGFSPFGTVLVLLVAMTGLINLLLITGWEALPELWRSQYGFLLGIKLALFAGMLVVAGLHRWLLAPALHSAIESEAKTGKALLALRLSLAAEFLISLLILAVVAWLGMTAPLTSA